MIVAVSRPFVADDLDLSLDVLPNASKALSNFCRRRPPGCPFLKLTRLNRRSGEANWLIVPLLIPYRMWK